MKRKKTNIEYRKKVIDTLRDQPRRFNELVERTKLPEKTVERILKELEYYGLVTKKEDRLSHWYWYTQVRTFQNWSEYKMWLNHSEQLLEALEMLAAMESPKSKPIEPRLLSCAEEHLKTGYPDIHRLLHDFREKEKELQAEIRWLKEKVFERGRNQFGELLGKAGPTKEIYIGDNVPEAVYRDLHARFRRYPRSTLWIDEKDCVCYSDIVIGKGSEKVFRLIEEFIESEAKEESNEKTVKRIITLEIAKSAVGSELAAKIRELVFTVKHGTPLEGECLICPSLRIVGAGSG